MGITDASSNIVGKRFKVIATYEPQQEDELSLLVGDIINILYVYDDGWVLGENRSTKSKGLAPGNFLEPFDHAGGIPQPRKSNTSFQEGNSYDNVGIQNLSLQETKSFKASNRYSSRIMGNEYQNYVSKQQAPQLMVNSISEDDLRQQNRSFSTSSRNPSIGERQRSAGSDISAKSVPFLSSYATNQDFSRLLNKLKQELDYSSFNCLNYFAPANIGSVNVFVCGDTGIGKSSLIERLVEHSIRPPTAQKSSFVVSSMKPMPFIADGNTTRGSQTLLDDGNNSIMVTKCSTIPLDLSIDGEERFNLKFIEFPGFGYVTDAFQAIRQCVEFCQRQFLKTNRMFNPKKDISKDQLNKYLNVDNGAHQHIDFCMYLILHRLKKVDIDYMHHISQFTNVVPVIIKSDTLSNREILQLKLTILQEMQKNNIPIFGFGLNNQELILAAEEGLKILKENVMRQKMAYSQEDLSVDGHSGDFADPRLQAILSDLKGLLPFSISTKKIVADADRSRSFTSNGRPTTMFDISFQSDHVGNSALIDRASPNSSMAGRSASDYTYPADDFEYMFRELFVKNLPEMRAEVAKKFVTWRSKLSA